METRLQGNCINCGTAWETVQQIRDLERELERLRGELEAERKVHHTLFQYDDSRLELCPAARQPLSEGAP